ncbi:28S ribosomal protein S35, mitochondrial-like [Haliotis rufescens]|uniref:28S ribosomal protein S35, mitochondrial-like n=1 Tax=Haliotis rufescens TaxID=6454 RepID=UPI00201F6BC3|nr:28S ribosomal protein S35, mitochondrial-like [Haliotis rufescens]
MAAFMESSTLRCAMQRLYAMKLTNGISCTCYARSISSSPSISHRKRGINDSEQGDSEFRTFEIPGLKPTRRERDFFRRRRRLVAPPRYLQMKQDQDWTSVWPTAASFKWSVVPLPLRQGFAEKETENKGVSPGKYGNVELMKPPNFLHLTPAHIKKHCQAIQKFCTKWPEGLNTNKEIDKHFPITVTTSDYSFSSASIRDPRARTVSVALKLSHLKLNRHAWQKMLRLVGDRFEPNTKKLTVTTDRCPLRQQNYDYAMYLLTAIYFESWKKEPWEEEMVEADRHRYIWRLSQSRTSVVDLIKKFQEIKESKKDDPSFKELSHLPNNLKEEDIDSLDLVREYSRSVAEIMNKGENSESLTKYKDSVKKILNLQTEAS